jgi:hypothetical protein
MNWDEGTWDSGFWDAPTPPVPPISPFGSTKAKNRTKMKRQDYYPSRIGDQVNWLANLAVKLPLYGPTLDVLAAVVLSIVNDAKWSHYVLSEWLSSVRAFTPASTNAVDEVLTGPEGAAAVTLPTYTAPALPDGVTPAKAGALNRIFDLIAVIKRHRNYTDAIGSDLGIVGPEVVEKSAPRFTLKLEQGQGCQCVRITFYKYTHMGVYIESRRGAAGVWEMLTIDTESPYLDERPLLDPNVPENREYRMRFWDKGTPNGDWTDVASVTVSP